MAQAPRDRRGHGIPLATILTGGNRNDVTQLLPLIEAVQAHARRRVALTGHRVSFNPVGPRDAGMWMEGRRMSRYQAGCAVIYDVVAAGNGRDVVVSIVQKG